MTRLRFAAAILAMAFLPVTAAAQSTGAIAGVVRDTTGAVLPGVTVEASSPALIEKVRAAVTDAQGNYRIVNLPPGAYAVAFTLPGFSTFRREGITLTAGFTAAANAEMKVGGLEETVTVTGASPVVDVQNTRTQSVVQIETIEALPVGRTRRGLAELTLGAVSATGGAPIIDQGGSKGEGTQRLEIHGMRGNDSRLFYDGMYQNNVQTGSGQNWMMNQLAVQEVVMGTSTASAEIETSGMTVNYVPKEGSNQFHFSFLAGGTREDLQADNLTDDIRATGVTSAQTVKRIYDFGGGLGGPIVGDRLWFYTSHRYWGSEEYQPGAFYSKSTSPFVDVPDLDRRAYVDLHAADSGIRLTWQAAEKHKINVDYHIQNACQCFLLLRNFAPPNASPKVQGWPMQMPMGSWNYTPSSKLLIEAGASFGYIPWDLVREDLFPDAPRVRELSPFVFTNGSFFGCCAAGDGENINNNNFNQRFSVSYITGSHSFKVGQQWLDGWNVYNQSVQQNLSYDLFRGAPINLTQYALPIEWVDRIRQISLYAQDQWTTSRLTLNLGVRYDRLVGWVPAGEKPATQFLPGFSYDRVDNVPSYQDISPRIGAAYDVFGNGKTAIKGAFGRYLGGVGITDITTPNNPEHAIALETTRNWNDADRDYVPDCVLTNFDANGECGAINNRNFGKTVRNTFYSPDYTEGFGNRAYSWQGNAQVQQELYPGHALSAAYFFTSYRNFSVTQNRAVAAANFNPYCITAPSDPRLPGGGGNQICGLYDVARASFGQVDNLVTAGSNFGDQLERFDGVELQLVSRLARGGMLTGGVSFGRKQTSDCYQNNRPDLTAFGFAAGTPRSTDFCDIMPPWSAGTQYKASGHYPLPWGGIEPSFTFQSLPGRNITATAPIANAAIAPSLGRNLSNCPTATGACNATATVSLIPGDALYLDRVNTFNVGLAKLFNFGGYRLKGRLDVYNVFNNSTVLNINTNFGAAWLQPTDIIGGRLFKFHAELNF